MANYPIDVYQVATHNKVTIWSMFEEGHYETVAGHKFNASSDCYLGVHQQTNEPLLFCAVRAFRTNKPNAWMTHRSAWRNTTDVAMICEFDDACGEYLKTEGKNLWANTPLKLLGEYRQTSPFWRATLYNLKTRKINHNSNHNQGMKHREWACYRHEFLGNSNSFMRGRPFA